MEDRRAGERYRVWTPVEITAPDVGPAIAVTYDASDRGLLLLTRTHYEVGAEVSLTIRLTEARAHRAHGEIVRVTTNDDDPNGLWPVRVAVRLEGPSRELDGAFAFLSAEHPLAPSE